MTKRDFERTAAAIVRRGVLGARFPLPIRRVRIELDSVRAELLADLCAAASLDAASVLVRALDEYAARHGRGAAVERASRTTRTT